MTRSRRTVILLSCLSVVAVAGVADARSKKRIRHPIQQANIAPNFHHFGEEIGFVGGPFNGGQPFALQDAPVGQSQAPVAQVQPASLHGGPIAAIPGGSLVIDADSGKLLRTDADGVKTAELEIAPGAAQVVVNPAHERAFVSDRSGDRIIVVDLADGSLTQVDALSTHAEPYGLAMTPDGATLLVTTVADRTLAAIEVSTGLERWSLEVGPEPRGVAISPDGREALVTLLTTGAVARVNLRGQGGHPTMSFVSLDPGVRQTPVNNRFGGGQPAKVVDSMLSNEGKSFARNAFAAAYIGHDIAVVPHQLSTPHLATDEFRPEASGYGGGNGFTAPVTHRLAFLATPDAGQQGSVQVAMASTTLHQPRALAYDGRSDTLYVAGYGTDEVLALANVSQASVHASWQHVISDGVSGCGPNGLAVDPDDGHVLVWCSLTRKVVRLAGDPASAKAPTVVAFSDSLAQSRLSASAQRGRELFRKGRSSQISTFGAMACASCHAEVRADGLSWRLQGNNLQTPFLAGRMIGAEPFKWDGEDPSLQASLTNTVKRLGGTGITRAQANDLAAFLKSVDPPRTPTVDDPAAVARGKALFEGEVTGCATCHSGPIYTDQQAYDLSADLGEVDTPSLVGLANSAPYYHDGSASTLEALLMGNANIHGMGRISKLDDAQVSDLVQYLKTL